MFLMFFVSPCFTQPLATSLTSRQAFVSNSMTKPIERSAPRFSGVNRQTLGKILIVLGLLGIPGSTYLGLKQVKQNLKEPVKAHVLKTADHTVGLLQQDMVDFRQELKGSDLVDMDAVKRDALNLAKKEAAQAATAAKEKAISKYQSLKEKLSQMKKGDNVEALENAVEKLPPDAQKELEKALNTESPSLESVAHFKAKLAEVTKAHMTHSNLNHENYKPVIDAAFEDIGNVVVRDGTLTASGVAVAITSVLAGMLLLLRKPD
jgi:hypothetical protein